MASTTFTDRQTLVTAAWANDVNTVVYKGVIDVRLEPYSIIPNTATTYTTQLQAAITYAKANGFLVLLPPGVIKTGQLNTSGGAAAWGMHGAGKYLTTLKHIDGTNTLIEGGSGSSVPYFLQGFGVNCQRSVYGGGNQGIAIADTSGFLAKDLYVTDYKETGILVYTATPNTYSNNRVEDCDTDGLGVGKAGIIIANMNSSGIRRCTAKGVVISPGMGVELKNECHNSWIQDCYVQDCFVGIGLGNDGTTATCVRTCLISGCVTYN